ncbi:MAG: phage tail protein [Sphingobacteriales bacterium]|nr:MAG: phage tail protein [Sphingobacteriales bacterium]
MFTDAYLGIITPWAGQLTRIPEGWLPCNGQTISIFDYQPLFSIIGTTYGGDGVSSFGLPDLQGRTAIHAGQGTGLPNYNLAQKGGTESVYLSSAQIGPHVHKITVFPPALFCSTEAGSLSTPVGNYPAVAEYDIYSGSSSTATMTATASASSPPAAVGSPVPVPTVSPYLPMYYIICVQGLYPPKPQSE